VLNPNMAGTELMLSPFQPWSNCTMADVHRGKKVRSLLSKTGSGLISYELRSQSPVGSFRLQSVSILPSGRCPQAC
jgi:hypothetical protein